METAFSSYNLNLRDYNGVLSALPNLKTYYVNKYAVLITGVFTGGALYSTLIWNKDNNVFYALAIGTNGLLLYQTSNGGTTWSSVWSK